MALDIALQNPGMAPSINFGGAAPAIVDDDAAITIAAMRARARPRFRVEIDELPVALSTIVDEATLRTPLVQRWRAAILRLAPEDLARTSVAEDDRRAATPARAQLRAAIAVEREERAPLVADDPAAHQPPARPNSAPLLARPPAEVEAPPAAAVIDEPAALVQGLDAGAAARPALEIPPDEAPQPAPPPSTRRAVFVFDD